VFDRREARNCIVLQDTEKAFHEGRGERKRSRKKERKREEKEKINWSIIGTCNDCTNMLGVILQNLTSM